MKLVVVSHTAHYRQDDRYLGWGPTVREIDYLTSIFDEIVHVAPLHPGPIPESALAYCANNVRLRTVLPAGGDHIVDKLRVLKNLFSYCQAILEELRGADVVHVRCPANISLVALLLLGVLRRPTKRWLKYAGDWCPDQREPVSYSLQRWLLRHPVRSCLVTMNGQWSNQPPHVHDFTNPCLTDNEVSEGRAAGGSKELEKPIRLLFVGRLDAKKGVNRILEILARLHHLGVDATLDVVGDGRERTTFKKHSVSLGVDDRVKFHGWLPRNLLAPAYSQSHFIVLPTDSEGWPKVLSEAMAYGVVPLTSNVGSIPQYLAKFKAGRVFAPVDVDSFANAIKWYCGHPGHWKDESMNGMKCAELFSYTNHVKRLGELLGLSVLDQSGAAEARVKLTLLSNSRFPIALQSSSEQREIET